MIPFLAQFLISATITLTWDPNPAANNVTKYTLYQKLENGAFLKLTDVPSGTTATVTVKDAQSYAFYVTATNAAGESDPSNQISYVIRPTLKISSLTGPTPVIVLSSNVFTGMSYSIEATRDFTSWSQVASGITSSDNLSVPFNPNPAEKNLNFRLKKIVPAQTFALLESTKEIPPLTYKKPTLWQKTRWALRYRPGMHPKGRFEEHHKFPVDHPTPPMPPSAKKNPL